MIIRKMQRYRNQDFHLLPSTLRLHGRELKQFPDADIEVIRDQRKKGSLFCI